MCGNRVRFLLLHLGSVVRQIEALQLISRALEQDRLRVEARQLKAGQMPAFDLEMWSLSY
jgi:hypothetical protein